MAVIGLFKPVEIKLNKENCLIYKPLCKLCKNVKYWRLAKHVYFTGEEFISLCDSCFKKVEEINGQI